MQININGRGFQKKREWSYQQKDVACIVNIKETWLINYQPRFLTLEDGFEWLPSLTENRHIKKDPSRFSLPLTFYRCRVI